MAQRETSSFWQRGRFRGFSLIELVTVLVIVVILAVFAAPRLFTKPTHWCAAWLSTKVAIASNSSTARSASMLVRC